MDEFHSFYYGTTCNEPETSDIVLPSGTEMTPTLLKELIDHHQENHVPRFKILKNAYENKYKIFSEEAKPKGKPDNRLSANFAKYITDTMNGFFIGIPIKVTHPNSDRHEIIKSFESRNVQEDLDSELSKHSSIYGVCYELLYQSDDGKAYSTLLKPLSAFKVYDDSVLRRSMYGVHYWYNEQGEVNGTFSDKEGVYSFSEKDGTLNIYDVEPHYFGDVPMIEYKDNDEKQGIYEGVLNLINAYNKALSEKANDVDYFADAYLKILGMVVDEEELNNMRTNRTINADDASAIVEFLQKPDGDATQENLIERLERLIFQLSMVADISDESFGTQSGIALKYKLQAMKNLAKTKERKFTASMKQRYRLLCNYPQIGLQEDDWEKLSFVFTLDYPANIAEEASIAANLSGTTSEKTRLSVLSIVDDPDAELQQRESEQAQRANLSVKYETSRTGVTDDEAKPKEE